LGTSSFRAMRGENRGKGEFTSSSRTGAVSRIPLPRREKTPHPKKSKGGSCYRQGGRRKGGIQVAQKEETRLPSPVPLVCPWRRVGLRFTQEARNNTGGAGGREPSCRERAVRRRKKHLSSASLAQGDGDDVPGRSSKREGAREGRALFSRKKMGHSERSGRGKNEDGPLSPPYWGRERGISEASCRGGGASRSNCRGKGFRRCAACNSWKWEKESLNEDLAASTLSPLTSGGDPLRIQKKKQLEKGHLPSASRRRGRALLQDGRKKLPPFVVWVKLVEEKKPGLLTLIWGRGKKAPSKIPFFLSKPLGEEEKEPGYPPDALEKVGFVSSLGSAKRGDRKGGFGKRKARRFD